VERVIGTIKRKITHALHNNKSPYEVLNKYHLTQHPATGMTPFQLFYARQPRLIEEHNDIEVDKSREAREIQHKVQEETARRNINERKRKNQKIVNLRQSLNFPF